MEQRENSRKGKHLTREERRVVEIVNAYCVTSETGGFVQAWA